MQLLEEHVSENIVKVVKSDTSISVALTTYQIGPRYYRQVVGIPQGSVLSAILCAYFYGDLESKKLADFGSAKDPQSVRLHFVAVNLLIYRHIRSFCSGSSMITYSSLPPEKGPSPFWM